MSRSLFARLFLAFALLLTQQGAFVHALTHVGEQRTQQQDGDAAPHHDCHICHAFTAAGGLAPGGGGLKVALPQDGCASFVTAPVIGHPALVRIASRGPPALV